MRCTPAKCQFVLRLMPFTPEYPVAEELWNAYRRKYFIRRTEKSYEK
jgi:hypothetical protein